MQRYKLGEEDDICAQTIERDGNDFTVSGATVTIADNDTPTVPIRSDASCTAEPVVNGQAEVFYHETFSSANGYVAGHKYTATFRVTEVRDARTYITKPVVEFQVNAAAS
jgi:hypothetical protein